MFASVWFVGAHNQRQFNGLPVRSGQRKYDILKPWNTMELQKE